MCREKTDSKGNVLFRGERERNDGRYEYRYTDHRGVQHSVYENRLQQLRMEEAKIAYRGHNRQQRHRVGRVIKQQGVPECQMYAN